MTSLRRHYPDQVTGSLVAPTSQPMGSPRDMVETMSESGGSRKPLPRAAPAVVFSGGFSLFRIERIGLSGGVL